MARVKYLLFCFSVMSFIATIKQSCPVKCVICAKVLSEATDRYAISGKGVSLTWLPDELKLLNVFYDSNGYLCRVCRRKVEKHRRIRENLAKSAEDIRSTMYGPSLKRDNTAESDLDSPVMKKPCVEIDGTNLSISLSSSSLYNASEFPSTKTNFPSPLPMTSTPKKAGRPPPLRLTEQKPEKPERVVKVSVKWPSEEYARERVLNDKFAGLGIALVRGTYSQMANAIFKIAPLRQSVIQCFLKEISRECAELTSKKNPSILRKNSTEDMRKFKLENVCHELMARTPLFYSTLLTSVFRQGRSNDKLTTSLPSVALAGCILLRERSPFLNAAQILMSLIMKFSGSQALHSRLSALKVTVSNSTFLKKLDEYGNKFDELVLEEKDRVSACMKKKAELKIKKEEVLALAKEYTCEIPESVVSAPSSPTVQDQQAMAMNSQIKEVEDEIKALDHMSISGMQFIIDNFDLRQDVRDMTCENQNKDYHWTNHNCVLNRVTGAHLDNDKPVCDLNDLSNGSVLPQARDHLNNRENYIVLVQRVLVDCIPALGFLKGAVQKHIPHKYSKEMAERTKKACLGIIFENENTSEGMLNVLKRIHSYLPSEGEGEDQHFVSANVIGDQLTVDRAVNALMAQQNGYTEEERMTGLNIGIADWHADMNFLQLCFKRHYSSESGGDKCTLFCDRNNINRRNVKSDVTSAYSPDRAMFTLAVKARIVVAALEILGMSDISGKPTRNTFPLSLPTASEATQRVYLRAIAAKVVDTYAIDSSSVNALLNQILSEEEQDEVQKNQAQTPDGRYPCRVPGCHKSFRFDGKSRRKHELTHGDHAELSSEAFMETKDTAQTTKAKEPNKSSDDMFNYQCSLLDHGLLYLNFRDAVAEGDGARIIRCWKFLLIQFWQESRKSKYALEALYLLFQIHALLTPCEAHQLVWNRSVNNHGVAGCNVPLDLDLEHDNNYIKEGNKKMGRNLTTTAVTRNCHCCKVAREIIEQYDLECKIRKRSGKHVQKSDGEDLRILVNLLLSEGALIETPGREYNHYAAFQRSQTSEIDMSSLFKWIDNHKKYILFNRRAR